MSVLPQPDADQTIPRIRVVSRRCQAFPETLRTSQQSVPRAGGRKDPGAAAGGLYEAGRVTQKPPYERRGGGLPPPGSRMEDIPTNPMPRMRVVSQQSQVTPGSGLQAVPKSLYVQRSSGTEEDTITKPVSLLVTGVPIYLKRMAAAVTMPLPLIVTDTPAPMEFIRKTESIPTEPLRIAVAGVQNDTNVGSRFIDLSVKKKWMTLTLRALVTSLLFVFLLKSISWSTLLRALLNVDHTYLLMGLAIGVVCVLFSSYGWHSLVLADRIHIDLARLIDLYLVGIAFSHFLPSSMGGDTAKAFYTGRESGNMVSSASAVLMSRITSFLGMLLIALPAIAILHKEFTHQVITWFVLLCLLLISAIAGAILVAALLPRFSTRFLRGRWTRNRVFVTVVEVGRALGAAAKKPRSMCAAILFGMLFWVASFLNYFGYASALGLHVPLSFYVIAIPFVSMIAAMPISINGFGVRESAFVYLFSTVHVPAATSLLLALLIDAQVLLFGIIGGCIYLTTGSSRVSIHRRGGAQ